MQRSALAAAVLALAALALGGVTTAHAKWGSTVNAGAGPKQMAAVEPRLAALVAAPDPAAIQAYIQAHLPADIEALKRYRNPELLPLFHALLDHEDWTLRHRALYALEYFDDPSLFQRAWAQLKHPEVRLREKAAITCIKAHTNRSPRVDLRAALAREADPHVRACLERLAQHVAGKAYRERVHEEVRVTRDSGLICAPFLSGFNNAKKVAPHFKKKEVVTMGSRAPKWNPLTWWTMPLLAYGEEVVSGVSLQPFANLRQGGTVYHLGEDVGACMEGSGYYAPADGVVRMVHAGGDMGTLIVTEHATGKGSTLVSVFMHGGDTVFVKGGDVVTTGQLIGTMGMGYSIENGGHFAHLHLGTYPGPFAVTHNYGYRSVKRGLSDWFDPAVVLRQWQDRTLPVVRPLPPLHKSLKAAIGHVAKGRYAAARKAAEGALKRAPAETPAHEDAQQLLTALGEAPARALQRVAGLRKVGRIKQAVTELTALAKALTGFEGADQLTKQAAAWKQDAATTAALDLERRIAKAEKRLAKDPEAGREALRKLKATCKDPGLLARINAQLR